MVKEQEKEDANFQISAKIQILVEMPRFLKEKFVIRKNVQFSQNGQIGVNVPKVVVVENNLEIELVFCLQFLHYIPKENWFVMDRH